MKIALFTNTYLPHVGGVARSVDVYEHMYRKLGHETLIFAPEFDGEYEDEDNVVRLPAITNFNDSGFSVRLPSPQLISSNLDRFKPDIIHAHHPFLVGDAALRVAYARDLPLVFTHHTLYERYTDYLPLHGEFAQRAAAVLATGYANACDLVFAPSESLAGMIVDRGVETDVVVQPTGIDLDLFANGDGAAFRRTHGIASDALLVGHVGRLAHEKNLAYLCEAVLPFLAKRPDAVFVLVGKGDDEEALKELVRTRANESQVVFTGTLQGADLAAAYASMDIFVFSSQSETQGLVLVEAMSSGTPVVALDGPGVRDVLRDGSNGLMLPSESSASKFAKALESLAGDEERRQTMGTSAAETAHAFDKQTVAEGALRHYAALIEKGKFERPDGWEAEVDAIFSILEGEWEILKTRASSAVAAVGLGESEAEEQAK